MSERLVKCIFGEIEFEDDTANIINNLLEINLPLSKADEICQLLIEGGIEITEEKIGITDYVIPELYNGTIM
jgi:hypothetical protein